MIYLIHLFHDKVSRSQALHNGRIYRTSRSIAKRDLFYGRSKLGAYMSCSLYRWMLRAQGVLSSKSSRKRRG